MNHTQYDTARAVEAANAMISGELSAVETYAVALDKFRTEPAVGSLRQIQADHQAFAEELTTIVRQSGGIPALKSGTWGNIVVLVETSAALFGEDSAITALATGEKLGRELYEESLSKDEFSPEVRQLAVEKVLPALERHLTTLEAIKDSE